MLDLKAYTTDYAKQQCDDLQEQLKELSDEKDVLKKDNDKKDKRVSECNAKITELESYYYKYITLCDYIVRINANPVREVITETIMRYSKKGKIKDSDHTFTGEVREILNILVQISANNNSLECIKEQLRKNQQAIKNNGDSIAVVIDKSNDGVEKLNFIQESIDSVSQKTDYVTIMLNSVKDNIGPDSEILGLLSSMNSCIGNEEDNSESDWSIKKNFCDINKKIEELLRKIELQDEMIRTFGEKYKCLEKSQNNMLKMIVVGELISVISVITLIMMQIF